MKKFAIYFAAMFLVFSAKANDRFSAQIEVDVEAQNSVEAKDKAMSDAQRQGLLEVAGRLISAENVEKLNTLSNDEVLHFVQSVSVENERAGGTKYKALLTVQIKEKLLKDYLLENGMISAEVSDLLVIPVYKEQAFTAPLLWEDNNAWRAMWQSKGKVKFGAMQVKTIGDDYADMAELSADSALYMDADLYTQLSERFGSDKIYVLYAETLANGDLKVTVKNEKNKSENSFSVYNDGNDELLEMAIEKSVMFISNMERESVGAAGLVPSGTINAVYVYANMKDWLNKSAQMTKLTQVEKIDAKSFGGGKVSFTIDYNGSLEELWIALQELGLSHEQVDNYYIIR